MTNPNPFLPQASLAEKQIQRRSRLKVAVSCVLAVSVIGLVGMLGCKRDSEPTIENPAPDTNTVAAADTNTPAGMPDTNVVTQPPVPQPGGAGQANGAGGPPPNTQPVPQPQPLPPVPPPQQPVVDTGVPATGSSEYVVVKGDLLSKIAKKTGVSVKALEAANPGVTPTKLKIGQKLTIPAGGKTVTPAVDANGVPTPTDASADGGTETYTVKAHDTLGKIAKAHHTTVKAIEAANGLTTTAIKVGKKLKIPTKAGAATTAPVAPVDTTPAPPVMPSNPAPVQGNSVPNSVPNIPAPPATGGK